MPLNAEGVAPEIVTDVVPATNPAVLGTVAVAVVEFTSPGPLTVPPLPVLLLAVILAWNTVALMMVPTVQVPLFPATELPEIVTEFPVAKP